MIKTELNNCIRMYEAIESLQDRKRFFTECLLDWSTRNIEGRSIIYKNRIRSIDLTIAELEKRFINKLNRINENVRDFYVVT